MLSALLAATTAKLLLSAGIGTTISVIAKQTTLWWKEKKDRELREKIK